MINYIKNKLNNLIPHKYYTNKTYCNETPESAITATNYKQQYKFYNHINNPIIRLINTRYNNHKQFIIT